jgi:two-component system sensor histidine kinase/response regulator
MKPAVPPLKSDQMPQLYARVMQLEHFFQFAPMGFALLSRDFHFRIANERYARLTHQSIDALIGKTLFEAIPELADVVMKMCSTVFETRTPLLDIMLTTPLPREGGYPGHWVTSFHPYIEANGTVEAVSMIVHELDRHSGYGNGVQVSAYTFRALFECSPLGIFMVDLNSLRLVESNPAFCRLLGYSHNKLLQKTLTEITHTQDCYANNVQLARMRSGAQATLSGETRLTRRTGTYLWIKWEATVIPDPNGQPAYGLVVVQDVTEPQNAVCAVQYRAEFEHLITTISTRFINVQMEQLDEGLRCALREIGEFMEVDFGFLFTMH